MSTPDTKLTIELATLLKGLQPTIRGLAQIEKSLKTVANIRPRDTQRNLKQTADASKRLADTQQRLINRQKQLEASSTRATNALERARLATQRLEQAKARLGRSTLPALDKQLNKIGRSLTSIGGGLKSFGTSLTVGLTAPIAALGILATRNAVSLDSLKRGLTAITGSAVDAAVQLERLREIAKAPGIGFQEAIQGSIRLQAVGFSALEAERALIQFANAVALTGGGRDELERVTVQLGQLAAKGKVVAQDLKPIIEAAPAVGQALLQAFGTVNSEDIQKLGLSTDQFLNKLLDALDDLPKAAAGAKNSLENFTDSVFVATSAIGEAILPPLTRIINTLEPIILDLADKFRALSPEIQTAVIAIGALAAAVGPVLFILGGIVTGLGSLVTGLTAVAGVIGTIGFPALLAILAGIAITVGRLAAAAVVVFKAWQTNFLGIRDIVARASGAVLKAFREIKGVINEATQRILPTLESITSKVVGVITRVWETYGKRVLEVVGGAFRFISDVTQTFLRQFGNFIDLILKLIDSDWKGAWQAFSRIVITAVDGLQRLLGRLNQIVVRALRLLISFILTQAANFVLAAEGLARKFIVSLATEILLGAPKIRNAIGDMLLVAAAGVTTSGIAALLVERLFAAMRKAAAEGPAPPAPAPGVGVDIGAGAGLFRRGKPKRPTPAGTGGGDEKQARSLLDKLKQAQDDFATAQAEARLALLRSGIQQQFELTKDGLDRELELLNANFEDRLVAVKQYFAERRRLQEAEIDSELSREKALSSALGDQFTIRRAEIERDFKTTKEDIERDPKLKGRQRTLALQTAEQKRQTDLAKALNDFETANADVSTRILQLQRQRKTVAEDLTREERNLTEELRRQQEEIRFDLLEEQGRTADAVGGRLKAQFRDTLRELRVDLGGLAPELQDALNSADLSVLQNRLEELPEPVRDLINLLDIGIKRAQIIEQQRLVDDLIGSLRLDEERIQNRVLDGVINEREARKEVLAVQQKYRAVLLDILAGELQKAQIIGDQSQILAIEEQITAVEQLGSAIDEVGQRLNQELFADIESGLGNIFDSALEGVDAVKQAIINLGKSILSTLNRIAAEKIAEKLFGDLLKPSATNTTGTLGGALSKLFGFAKGDMLPAAPGGRVVRVAEGGFDEAILTTDPKHATRQAAILREYLKQTKGLFGRVKLPEFAEGGFISARDAEMNLLSSIQRSPSFVSTVPDGALAMGASGGDLRLRQIFVDDQRDVRNYLNSPEGEQVIAEKLVRNQFLIKRLAR